MILGAFIYVDEYWNENNSQKHIPLNAKKTGASAVESWLPKESSVWRLCSPEQRAEKTAQHAGILEDVCGKGLCAVSVTEKSDEFGALHTERCWFVQIQV